MGGRADTGGEPGPDVAEEAQSAVHRAGRRNSGHWPARHLLLWRLLRHRQLPLSQGGLSRQGIVANPKDTPPDCECQTEQRSVSHYQCLSERPLLGARDLWRIKGLGRWAAGARRSVVSHRIGSVCLSGPVWVSGTCPTDLWAIGAPREFLMS